MQRSSFLAVGPIIFLIATSLASNGPAHDSALEKAFADAHLQIVTSYQRDCLRGKLLATKPLPSPKVMATMPGAGHLDWHLLAVETRRTAEKLAKENGRAMGSYLREAAPNPLVGHDAQAAAELDRTYIPTLSTDASDILLLLTLDALGMKDETALAAWRMATQKGHRSVLLKASFCSQATRVAAANLLYSEGIRQRIAEKGPAYQNWSGIVGFAAVVGNKETADLLSKVAKEQREKGLIAYELENAVGQISARLSLPPEKRSQREADELLYWQMTTLGLPEMEVLYERLGFSAERLAASGCSISPAYLIERVEEIKGLSSEQLRDHSGSRGVMASLVLYIIGVQKEDSAIPAMLRLVQRRPNLLEGVKRTLKQIGTPKAEEAFRTLSTQNQPPETQKR